MKQLVCEICKEVIGQFEPDEVTIPIDATMFKSKLPERGLPAPFPGSIDWRWMKCPHCGKRPFIFDAEVDRDGPVRLLTTEGFWEISPEGEFEVTGLAGDEFTVAEPEPSGGPIVRPSEEPHELEEPETHTCTVCGRTFSKRMALVGHMKAHRKLKGEA